MNIATGITGVANTLHGKLLACANVAYEVTAPGKFHSDSRWFEAAGFLDIPSAVIGGALNENAALVGRVEEGTVIAFRGTLAIDDESKPFAERLLDWITDLHALLVDWRGVAGKVHAGFAGAFMTLQAQIDPLITAGIENLFFVGHSKGGALARLAAIDDFKLLSRPGTVVTFGAPRVGNVEFAKGYAATPIRDFRFEAAGDIVPHVPFKDTLAHTVGEAIGQDFPSFDYESVGFLRFINSSGQTEPESASQHLRALADVAKPLAERDFSAIRQAHSIDIGSAYARAVTPEVSN
jgi:hypothetical protein